MNPTTCLWSARCGLVVPTDEELSKLAHTLRHPSAPQIRTGSELPAGATVPRSTRRFRPAVGDIRVPGPRRAARVFTTTLLLAGCPSPPPSPGSLTAMRRTADRAWSPQHPHFTLPLEKPASAATDPARRRDGRGECSACATGGSGSGRAANRRAERCRPVAESAQSLRAMAHDLASAGQEIEQLKASIEHLKAASTSSRPCQQQMSTDIAKLPSKPGAKMQAPPRRPAAARCAGRRRFRDRRPPLAPMPTQAAAPYVRANLNRAARPG